MNTNPDLSPRLRLLITCCQVNPSEEDIKTIQDLICDLKFNGSDWNDLSILAHQHGIFPLFYRTLKLNALNLVLPETMSELKSAYMIIAQRNILMSAELIHITKLLNKNDIEAIAFKGPSLAQIAYGDITLRQYVDLDILVNKDQVYEAGKLMSDNGHHSILPLTILRNAVCLDTAKDFSLMSEKSAVHTELHWHLFEKRFRNKFTNPNFSTKYQNCIINNTSIKTLANEMLIVYLCLHGSKHGWERIEWICDIDRLVRAQNINWNKSIEFSKQLHSVKTFHLGLGLSRQLFYTPLPEKIQKNIGSKEILTLISLTKDRFQVLHNNEKHFEHIKNNFFYQIKLMDTSVEKITYLMNTIFKISIIDCQTFILPERLKFLYIFLRPFRLILGYSKRIFGDRLSA